MAKTYEFISKVTATGSSSLLTISNIPQGYSDLVFVGDGSFNNDNIMNIFVNSTTATNNMSFEYFWYTPNTANTGKTNNGNIPYNVRVNGTYTLDILDYTNSDKYKAFQMHNTEDRSDSSSGGLQWLIGTFWTTSPITSITFANYNVGGYLWNAGSSVSVFGIKRA